MENLLEKTARRELDEELKRGRPKDAKKLYDMMVKRVGRDDAYTFMLEMISRCFVLMPNGRYRLDSRQYNAELSEKLKQEKKNKVPALNPKPKKQLNDFSSLLEMADEDYEQTPMSDFAAKFSMLMIAEREEEAVQLYIENSGLFKEEMNQRTAEYPAGGILSADLDRGEYKGYFLSNLINDIIMAFYNTTIHEEKYLPEFDDFLRFVLAKPVNWSDNPGVFSFMLESACRVQLLRDNTGDAEVLYETLKEKEPNPLLADLIYLRAMQGIDTRFTAKRRLEAADCVYSQLDTLTKADALVLNELISAYEKAGLQEKADVCRRRLRELK